MKNNNSKSNNDSNNYHYVVFLIGIHSMQDWTATMRHGVTSKRNIKRLKHKRIMFQKNLELKSIC